MLPYRKDGHEYILMANSKRGIMKVSADDLTAITPRLPRQARLANSHAREATVLVPRNARVKFMVFPYETVAQYKGVWQLAKIDEGHALVLSESTGKIFVGSRSCKQLHPRSCRRIRSDNNYAAVN